MFNFTVKWQNLSRYKMQLLVTFFFATANNIQASIYMGIFHSKKNKYHNPNTIHSSGLTSGHEYNADNSMLTPSSVTSMHHSMNVDKLCRVYYVYGESTITMGSRTLVPLLGEEYKMGNFNFFKVIGIVVKTKGSKMMRTACVVVSDYIRFVDGKYVPKSKVISDDRDVKSSDSISIEVGEDRTQGPSESSRSLRIGDVLYSINGKLVLNKSKRQILKIINQILHSELENRTNVPLTMIWRHGVGMNEVSFEQEVPLPVPSGEYYRSPRAFGHHDSSARYHSNLQQQTLGRSNHKLNSVSI